MTSRNTIFFAGMIALSIAAARPAIAETAASTATTLSQTKTQITVMNRLAFGCGHLTSLCSSLSKAA